MLRYNGAMKHEATPAHRPPAHLAPKPAKKRRGRLVLIGVVLVLAGVAVALEFLPGSPLQHAIYHLFNPPVRVDSASVAAKGAEAIRPDGAHPVELAVTLLVPDDWEKAPAANAESASGKLGTLHARAFTLIRDCGLETTEITFTLNPETLAYEAEKPYRYAPGYAGDAVVWSGGPGNGWRYAPRAFALPSPFVALTVDLEEGDYLISAAEYLIDGLGLVWEADATVEAPLRAAIAESTSRYEIIYRPVDLAGLPDGEFARVMQVAGPYADALSAARALALEAAA